MFDCHQLNESLLICYTHRQDWLSARPASLHHPGPPSGTIDRISVVATEGSWWEVIADPPASLLLFPTLAEKGIEAFWQMMSPDCDRCQVSPAHIPSIKLASQHVWHAIKSDPYINFELDMNDCPITLPDQLAYQQAANSLLHNFSIRVAISPPNATKCEGLKSSGKRCLMKRT